MTDSEPEITITETERHARMLSELVDQLLHSLAGLSGYKPGGDEAGEVLWIALVYLYGSGEHALKELDRLGGFASAARDYGARNMSNPPPPA